MEERKMIEFALEILRQRSTDYTRDYPTRCAYESAVQIIEYALEGNYECLCQFNY